MASNSQLERSNLAGTGGAPKLAEIVYEQIVRLISRGEFPQECKLPTEAELSSRFGVSRPILREALKRLREAGFVRSQQGSGTIVIRGMPGPVLSLPPVRTITDLLRSYEFRVNLETATVSLAAERCTRENLQEIEEVLSNAKDLLERGLYELLADMNFAFHRAIARATQNQYYIVTLESMPSFIGRSTLDLAGPGGTNPLERAKRVHREHEIIFAAIKSADLPRARSEMERHIISARDVVLESQTYSLRRSARGGKTL